MRLPSIYEFQSKGDVAVVIYFRIPVWQCPGLTVKNPKYSQTPVNTPSEIQLHYPSPAGLQEGSYPFSRVRKSNLV
jgi:hypothetical protein